VAERDGALLGTYRLTEMDRIAWPEAAPDEAFYLHTLGVSRSVAASGLGNALLDHSCEITKQRGFPELRLDCWDGNVRLRRFYAEAGFEYPGRYVYQDGGAAVRGDGLRRQPVRQSDPDWRKGRMNRLDTEAQ